MTLGVSSDQNYATIPWFCNKTAVQSLAAEAWGTCEFFRDSYLTAFPQHTPTSSQAGLGHTPVMPPIHAGLKENLYTWLCGSCSGHWWQLMQAMVLQRAWDFGRDLHTGMCWGLCVGKMLNSCSWSKRVAGSPDMERTSQIPQNGLG